MTRTTSLHGELHEELRRAQRAIADLRRPKLGVYFFDLFVTASTIWIAMVVASRPGAGVLGFVVGAFGAGLALSRAVLFAHELSHQRGALPGLRLAWHLLVGVPFLFPSFLYEHVHRRHHHVAVYRTEADPEHAPDARSFRARTAGAQLAALALPLLLIARWLLAPISPWSPRLRSFVLRRFSSLTTNAQYTPPAKRSRGDLLAEIACALWSYGLVAALVMGALPLRAALAGAVAIAVAASVSDLRGEVLHRFQTTGRIGTLERQVLDSVNVPSTNLVTRVFFPMGIGYHALHHLAPSLPYHAIEEAHARLLRVLGPDSFYARSTERSLASAIANAVLEGDERAKGRATLLQAS